MDLQFQPGKNIAMKVPAHEHKDTVRFYRDVLRLKDISSGGPDDIDQAAEYLKTQGLHRRDGIEPLPEGFQAFWISSPSNIIHLVSER